MSLLYARLVTMPLNLAFFCHSKCSTFSIGQEVSVLPFLQFVFVTVGAHRPLAWLLSHASNCLVFSFKKATFESKLSFCSFPAVCAIPFIFVFSIGDNLHNTSSQKCHSMSAAEWIAILFPTHSCVFFSFSLCARLTPLDITLQFESAKSHTTNPMERKREKNTNNEIQVKEKKKKNVITRRTKTDTSTSLQIAIVQENLYYFYNG